MGMMVAATDIIPLIIIEVGNPIVSLTAVLCLVTHRSSQDEERCVTSRVKNIT